MRIDPKLFHAGLISYCILIFILSSIPGDNFPEVNFEFSDKIVHVIIYGILCTLFFYSLNNQGKSVKLQKFSPEFALFFTAVYGITDELHQYFVPNRSCELSDWIADITGGLAVYLVIKHYRSGLKAVTILLLLFTVQGCTSAEKKIVNESGINVLITEADVWLNLMPVTGEKDNILGFLISMNIESDQDEKNYSIKNFEIFLNNDTLRSRKFTAEVFKEYNELIKINISQFNEEKYLDKNREYPAEAEIHFDIYKDNKKIRSIKTSKIKINKVY